MIAEMQTDLNLNLDLNPATI